jgi:hypothetical protein
MKLRTILAAIFVCCVSFVATSSQAQQAPNSCETYKCVAGISGYTTKPAPTRQCAPALQTFFKIAVFNPPIDSADASIKHTFDPNATAAKRREYLMTCPDAAADTNTVAVIINKWLNVK